MRRFHRPVTIDHVEFHNFRCLRDVSLRLGQLTALVGANATGKSTVLRGMQQHFVGVTPAESWQRSTADELHRVVSLSDGRRYLQGASARPRGTMLEAVPPYARQHLHLSVDALRGENRVQEETRLAEDGSNLTNMFATLPRRVRDQLAAEFCRFVPVFSDVDARPSLQSGQHRLVFQDRWREKVWYDPQEVSDGTMLMLAFLLLQYQTVSPDLITLEEPERGLHPYLMQQLVTLLRGIASGTIGPRAIQILLATHSAELLEHLQPEEVRFLSRGDDGAVAVEEAPVNDPDWRIVYDEYQRSLGGLWLSGNLGGVPRSAA